MIIESAPDRRSGFSEAVALAVSCRDQEVDGYWAALLADGGTEACAAG